MPEILIDIRNKIPTLIHPAEIVTDNTDYTVRFTWDDEWETAGIKTVFFVSATGENMPVVMEGNTCAVPMITAWRALYIGVQAGELHTTRPCAIRVAPSIARQIGDPVTPEEFDKWTQIMARLLSPVDKTDDMTVPVGRDAAGKLWTAANPHPYLSLERLRSYLYRVTFREIPAYSGAGNPVAGGCTSYVQDGKLHRNFDWTYDDAAEFEVVCPGFRGIALLGGLTDGHLEDDLIGQLPYHLADGRNDSGIMVSEHVLYNDWDWTGSGTIPMTQIPYRILSSVTSLDDFPEQISELLADLSVPSALAEQEYLLQFLVTDGTTTYCIMPPESTSGAYQCVDITENPKLTNFRWVSEDTVDRADLQERPTGVERWNIIPATLEELRFTATYESPDRLSEFIGLRGTTKDSTDAELYAIWETAHELYLERQRDGSLWQTVHSVVYSAAGVKSLWVQEDYNANYGSSTGGGGSVSIDYEPETGDLSITTTGGGGGGGSVSVDYDPETGDLSIATGGGGAGTWDELADKPFERIGETLAVTDGTLEVNIHEVSNDAGGLTTIIG